MGNLAGRTIKLFLVDGIPDGIRTAEIMSWTGHVLFAPRSSVAALLARPEAKRTGAYLLIGPNRGCGSGHGLRWRRRQRRSSYLQPQQR